MSGGGGDGAEPDLTPMLDMVFQLITFFMLVTNMKAAALDLNLKLPVVGSARPVDTKGVEELLILNVTSDGKINQYGIVKDPGPYIASEAQVSRMAANKAGGKLEAGDELPTRVVIRCDRATTFASLFEVIKLCQDQGFVQFALRAMDREADK